MRQTEQDFVYSNMRPFVVFQILIIHRIMWWFVKFVSIYIYIYMRTRVCVCLLFFFYWWHINLHELFNAKTHPCMRIEVIKWLGDERVHAFPKCISPKANVITLLEFELAYCDIAVQHTHVHIYIYIYIYI